MADNNEQNPWTRPGWIISAVVVAVVLVLGIVITITTVRGSDADSAPADTVSYPGPTITPHPGADTEPSDESICGIGTVQLDGAVTESPEAEWAFEGTTAYPTSSRHGPGETADNGIRTCFEHSPTGAVFMAANLLAMSYDAEVAREWSEYVVAPGPFRDEQLAVEPTGAPDAGNRLDIQGFRLLNYTGDTARVELGVAATSSGQTGSGSFVYELVWHEGDWRVSGDVENPLDVAPVPDFSGYIPWGP